MSVVVLVRALPSSRLFIPHSPVQSFRCFVVGCERVAVFRKRMGRIAQRAAAGLQLIGSPLHSWTALFRSDPDALTATAADENDYASGKDEVQAGGVPATAASAALPWFCLRRPQLSAAFDTWLPAAAVPPALLGVQGTSRSGALVVCLCVCVGIRLLMLDA